MMLVLAFAGSLTMYACMPGTGEFINQEPTSDGPALENSVTVSDQQLVSDRIKSIELFQGRPGSLPMFTLNSSEFLILRFDEISDHNSNFTVRLTHHNSDWTESTLITNFFLRGFSNDIIDQGKQGASQYPGYFTYEYRFPNRDFGVSVSGNYLMHIYDYNTNEKLFSVPFFVREDRGGLSASIEEFFDFGSFPNHQIFANYTYPDFIGIPQMDLSLFFVQNQFWGRYKTATEMDVSRQGQVRVHNTREDGFYGRYEFRPLLLSNLQSISRDVLEVFPDRDPPLVRLQYDVVDLDVNPRQSRAYRYGQPHTERSARYAEVEFNLDRPSGFDQESKVYIYGSFNNWQISEANRMHFDAADNAFRGTALIKEGRYDYKYAVVEDGVIDDLRLDAFFAESRQDYQVLVYFHDRQQQFDRLLQVGTITSR